MFLDDLPTAPRYDAIIVGAGPAGVSCAMALAAARRRVLVLEAGGRQAVIGDHTVGGHAGRKGFLVTTPTPGSLGRSGRCGPVPARCRARRADRRSVPSMPREPTPAVHAGTLDRRDVVLACVCGAVALAAYLRTLAPGLTSDQDSPLFQFIGRALGVAHNPGYPLFTLLTWPIAQLPIGELAWRINVFSAAMGAIAVGLVYLAARQLAARPIVAAGAALGFAAGATFWSQAVIAEVYTLHAALVAGLLAAAFAWSRSRRPGHFHAALGCLAAGLGHHTTILAFAPGLALLAGIVDRRFAFRLRTLATSAAIVALGVLPYALILVRSRDPEAYVESRATTLAGLAQVVLGRQFRDRLFGDDWRALAATQAPLLWQRVFGGDLTWAGLALAALGALWLLRRRPGEALLMASAPPS